MKRRFKPKSLTFYLLSGIIQGDMELVRFPSSRGFSVRSILTFVIAVITAALLLTPLLNTSVSAAPTAEWSGESIIYNEKAFTLGNNYTDTTATIPEGATVYKTTVQNGDNTNKNDDKVMIIYFAPGVDPPTATSAKFVSFSLKDGELSSPTGKADITLTTQSESDSGSTCNVSGIGWIVCPVSVFLAEAMDTIFNLLTKMLAVQPAILGDTSNSMYVAWNVMRSIANVLFVILFLIIIYSQLTNIGVSNYGIKRTLPRLVIAAVLVNVSFYISALAVDISNILGYSLQDLFNTVREQVFHLTDDDLSGLNTNGWGVLTAAALSGAGVIGGVLYLAGGGQFLLIPILLGFLLTILFVLIILAARQAIIVILVIISPLAFVAFLLPNTEKLFDKWKGLFMTMLIFFPAFSVIFGGSQLAGQLIIQNAGGDFFMLLFGLSVQVAALALTPMILKFSGGVLGKIAQITNDPKRGILDRNRNWANERAKEARARNIAQGPRLRDPTSWGSSMLRKSEFKKRDRQGRTQAWEQEGSNLYEQTRGARKVHEMTASANLDKERISADNERHIETLKGLKTSPLHDKAINTQAAKDNLQTSQQNLSGYHNTLRTVGGTTLNQSQINLESSKAYSEASQKDNEAYLNEQRTFRFSKLGQAAERLEASKLYADGWQSQYAASMDNLKVDPASVLGKVNVTAQVQKNAAEAAKLNVQAVMDKQSKTDGSSINLSTLELEAAKLSADTAKASATTYLNRTKSEADGVLHVKHAEKQLASDKLATSEATLKYVTEEYKAGHKPAGITGELADIVDSIRQEQIETSIAENRSANASRVQQDNLANEYINNEDIRVRAGGIYERGADAAMARATATMRSEYSKSVGEADQIIKHFNLSSDQRQRLALGETITAVRDDGTTHTFTPDDVYIREAAIEKQIAVGTIDQVEDIVKRSGTGGDLHEFRTTISEALAKNGLGNKGSYLGGKTIDDVAKGDVLGDLGILDTAMQNIAGGKVSEKKLTEMDAIAVQRLLEAAAKLDKGELPSTLQGIGANGKPKATPEKLAEIDDYLYEIAEQARSSLEGQDSGSITAKAKIALEKMGKLRPPKNP